MTDEEYQREQEEAERLRRQINNVIDQINRTNRENAELEAELDTAIDNVNLERDTKTILKTSIHEIAHNMEYSLHGNTGHTKRFYLIYRNLLETAIRLGLFDYDDIKTLYDIQKLTKTCGSIVAEYGSLSYLIDNKSIIKVNKSFAIKDILKQRGYAYNKLEQNWVKEMDTSLIDEEVKSLSSIIDGDNIEVTKLQNLKIQAMSYVVVDNAFQYKDTLKENGYIYRGYGYHKGSSWVKKIYLQNIDQELNKLKEMQGIVVNIQLINGKTKKQKNSMQKY